MQLVKKSLNKLQKYNKYCAKLRTVISLQILESTDQFSRACILMAGYCHSYSYSQCRNVLSKKKTINSM